MLWLHGRRLHRDRRLRGGLGGVLGDELGLVVHLVGDVLIRGALELGVQAAANRLVALGLFWSGSWTRRWSSSRPCWRQSKRSWMRRCWSSRRCACSCQTPSKCSRRAAAAPSLAPAARRPGWACASPRACAAQARSAPCVTGSPWRCGCCRCRCQRTSPAGVEGVPEADDGIVEARGVLEANTASPGCPRGRPIRGRTDSNLKSRFKTYVRW